MARTYNIISADSHVNPPTEMWGDYLPNSLKGRAPRLESTPEGDFRVFEGKRTPINILGALAGRKTEDYALTGKEKEALPGGWDPKERIKDQDIDSVDAEVLYGGGPLQTEDQALKLASHEAYNDWLADFCSESPERLFGIGYLPIWDIEKAMAETRRVVSKGLRGVLIPAFAPVGRYDEPEFERLWDLLEELNVAAHIHVGARHVRFDSSTNFLVDMVMSKQMMAEPVSLFIFSGILARHPKLRLVEVEGGVGWCAFVVQYMDHIWQKHRHWTKSVLTEPPSFYFHRQVLGTFLDDKVGVDERHVVGVENIMWSSDYPHSETTWPNSVKMIEEHFAGVPKDETYKITCGNAARLYNIG